MTGGEIEIRNADSKVTSTFNGSNANLVINYSGSSSSASEIFTGTFSNNTINSLRVVNGSTFTIDANSPFNQATNLITSGHLIVNKDFNTTNFTANGMETIEIGDATLTTASNTTIDELSLNNANSKLNVTGNLEISSGLNINADVVLDDALNISGAKDINSVYVSSNNSLTIESDTTLNNFVILSTDSALDIGNNTLTINGNLGIYASTLKLNINSEADYGKIVVTDVNIDTGSTLQATVASDTVVRGQTKEFNLIDYSGNLTGSFDNLLTISNTRYSFEHVRDGIYSLSINKTAADIAKEEGGSKNDQETASAWLDSSSFETGTKARQIADNLDALSQDPTKTKEYVNALKALAPDAAPSVQSVASSNVGQIMGAVGNRIGSGSFGGNKGMASGDYAVGKSAIWGQGLYNHAEFDNNSTSKGFDSDTYGLAMGIEHNFTDNIKLGVGYAYTNSEIDGFLRNTDVDTHSGIIYGEYKPSNWFISSVMSYGFSRNDETKNVAGSNVTASYDVETLAMQATTGYEFKTNFAKITPETGIRYMNVSQESYIDSASQNIAGGKSDTVTGILGAKLNKEFMKNDIKLTPELKFATTYDFNKDNNASIVSLANGNTYKVKGTSLERFGFETGINLGLELNNMVELSIGYEGKFREDYQDHTGLFNVKYNF